jgi:uncharacterized membrane protein YhhN
MYLWLILALLFAVLEAVAVARYVQKLEYIAKPAVMVCLFLWLYSSTGLSGNSFWFGAGIMFSLVGDVLLMVARGSRFLFGLIAFLFAHIAYITGFGKEVITISAWSLIALMFIAMGASRLLWRITGAMRAKGNARLILPVTIYGAILSVMLYAAMSTMYDPVWKTKAALFVGLGAFLFWISDLILAWNKFVTPIPNGRVLNIMMYHLGQIGLIAGVISQFG